jgi:hypothetical protein
MSIEAVVAYLKVTARQFTGGIKKNHEESQAG